MDVDHGGPPATSDADDALAGLRHLVGGLKARLEDALRSGQHWACRAVAAEAERDAVLFEVQAMERCRNASSASRGRSGLPAGRIPHVGGRHDHPSLLAGLVSQAGQVVFPANCVRHDAALTVKRLCRQLGRPWPALRSSGLASFPSALAGTEAAQARAEALSLQGGPR